MSAWRGDGWSLAAGLFGPLALGAVLVLAFKDPKAADTQILGGALLLAAATPLAARWLHLSAEQARAQAEEAVTTERRKATERIAALEQQVERMKTKSVLERLEVIVRGVDVSLAHASPAHGERAPQGGDRDRDGGAPPPRPAELPERIRADLEEIKRLLRELERLEKAGGP